MGSFWARTSLMNNKYYYTTLKEKHNTIKRKKETNKHKKPFDTHKMLSIVSSIAFVALKYCWAAYLQQYARFVIIYQRKVLLKSVSVQRFNQRRQIACIVYHDKLVLNSAILFFIYQGFQRFLWEPVRVLFDFTIFKFFKNILHENLILRIVQFDPGRILKDLLNNYWF